MIRLGLRLVTRGGRESGVRLAITALGVAVGGALLLFTLAAAPAMERRGERLAWHHTSADNIRDLQDPATTDPVLWRQSTGWFRGEDVVRVDVAALGLDAPLPPGVAGLPGPGEVVVSPALGELLERVPADQLGDRFPGRVVARIGEAGLVHPDELVAIVGHTPGELEGTDGVIRARAIEAAPDTRVFSDFLRLALVVGAVGLLAPASVFVAASTRLAAARREQRLAALRLAGATPRQVRVAAALEALLPAVAGTGGSLLLFAAARPLVAMVSIEGSRFFPGDLTVPAGQLAVVVAGMPLAGVVAALVALRRVQVTPLGVQRRSRPCRPTARRLLPLPVALAVLATLAILGTNGMLPSSSAELLLGVSFGAVTVGLVLAGPFLTLLAARWLARRSRRVPGLLAARRLADDPRAAFRAISGVVLAVFVGSVFGSIAPAVLASASTFWSPLRPGVVEVRLPMTEEAPARAGELEALAHKLGGIDGVDRVAPVWLSPRPQGATYAAVTDCSGLLAAVAVEACPAPPGRQGVRMEDGRHPAAGLGPAGTLRDRASLAPAELDGYWPVALYVVTTERAAAERARTAAITLPGRLLVTSAGEVTARGRGSLADLQWLVNVGILVTLLIAGCSLAVAAAGALLERRRPFALLRLAGMPLAALRRVVLVEAAAPLALTAAASAALGLLVGVLVLYLGEVRPLLQPPSTGYLLTLAAGVAGALLLVASTLPLLGRVTAVEAARFE